MTVGTETMQAAGDVIAARLQIMGAAMTDPSRADLMELSLMGSEKVQAISASAAATASHMGAVGGRMAAAAFDEAGQASRAFSAMAGATSPATLASLQFDYALGWWSRATEQMFSLNAELTKAQADAAAPIHRMAVANARRLKR